MEKVLIITYYWPPSGGAGVQRILKFVKYLPGYGIKPYIITVNEDKASYPVIDNSLSSDIPEEAVIIRTDTFEPYDLYSKILRKKSIPTGFSNESEPGMVQIISRFIRGNFFIPDARIGWGKFAIGEAVKIIENEKINTIITTSPPHSVQVTGLKLKEKFRHIRWIADLRDPWTDIYYYNEFSHLPFARKKDLLLEKKVLENADEIITVSKSLRELFLKKSEKINPEKIKVIHNGFDEDDFKKNVINDKKGFIITYTGTIAESYNPHVFFHALKDAVEKIQGLKFLLRFVGNPASSLIKYANDISLSGKVEVIPSVTHERSVEYLLESDALLLVIPEIKNDKGILTGKLFEYLAARKPVICIGPAAGDAAEIIKECKAGKTFERNMQKEITDFICQLAADRNAGINPLSDENVYKNYSRQNQAKMLSEIIKTKF